MRSNCAHNLRIKRLVAYASCFISLLAISGCAGVLVGSAATSAVVAHDERTTGTFIEDQAIEIRSADALRKDAELREQAHLSVTSYNQIVLLTGQAPSAELKHRAVSIVRQQEKVRDVFDEIQIAAPNSLVARSADSLLTAKVKTKLFTLDDLDATRVKVVTESGVVFLMGIISQVEGDVAARGASQVNGVLKVVKLFEYSP